MLQDADIPQTARDKLNHMINTQFACIISQSSADIGRTNLVEMFSLQQTCQLHLNHIPCL